MMNGSRKVSAPRGAKLNCKGWHQEAALRCLMNNLDPEVAERPDDLVVYGGTGRAARNWAAFDAIVRELLDKMRQDVAAEAAARGQAAGRQCPLGHGALVEEARGSVVIDRCEKCGGIWLDQGELEEMSRQSGGWFDNFVKSFKNE